MVALTLAPITLVQPVGVLAVPVTVVAAALARRRRPAPTQVLGSVLNVVGVAALTVVLLLPAAQPATLPSLVNLAVGTGTVLVGGGAVALLLGRTWAPPLLRCVVRAVVAAALFGLNSVLIRALGEIISSSPVHPVGLVVTSLAGIALALPLVVWAMQSTNLFGSPQVVICCLTLIDPVTAVVGGKLLLQDGARVTGLTLAAAVACAVVTAAGVVLLARDYPADDAPELMPGRSDGDLTDDPRSRSRSGWPQQTAGTMCPDDLAAAPPSNGPGRHVLSLRASGAR